MFLKMNVALPGLAIDFVVSLKKNSPPVTWIVVASATVCRSLRAAESGTSASDARANATSVEIERMVCFVIGMLLAAVAAAAAALDLRAGRRDRVPLGTERVDALA